ncbi:hypothetical protein VNO80_16497 [Phaseolus coccineus]|uniref:Uncharacterized protein n=1 Tax=Phaseolus coccineus TaxID=3886 RepID=A0AAN9R818_PHACN
MVEENSLLVPKIPVGVSGTALAASLLRDGWSLAKMYSKYQEAVHHALRHENLGRKESEAVLQQGKPAHGDEGAVPPNASLEITLRVSLMDREEQSHILHPALTFFQTRQE